MQQMTHGVASGMANNHSIQMGPTKPTKPPSTPEKPPAKTPDKGTGGKKGSGADVRKDGSGNNVRSTPGSK
jgi:hypothetical protein